MPYLVLVLFKIFIFKHKIKCLFFISFLQLLFEIVLLYLVLSLKNKLLCTSIIFIRQRMCLLKLDYLIYVKRYNYRNTEPNKLILENNNNNDKSLFCTASHLICSLYT